MKKLMSVLLALALVLAMVPVAASAEGEILTADDLKAAVGNGGEIVIGESISLTETLTIETNVTIDLNGYTIDRGSGFTSTMIRVAEGGSLTIEDLRGNGQISSSTGIAVENNGTFTLLSGTIDANNSSNAYGVRNRVTTTSLEENQAVICNIEGGTISSDVWGVVFFGAGMAGQTDGNNSALNTGVTGSILNNMMQVNISGNAQISGLQALATAANNGIYAGFTVNISGNAEITGINEIEGCAMYLPGYGVTNISGGTISGGQGIRISAGELNITGGTIEGTTVSDGKDLVAGGSTGTQGAIVVGKASSGYVGNVNVHISGDAVVTNTAEGEGTKPAIVVSDKNMSDNSMGYDDLAITVTVDGTEGAEISGDVVKVSNLTTSTTTQDGGNTSLTISNTTVSGNVTNQSKTGLTIRDTTINGNVSNTSEGSTAILGDSTVSGNIDDSSDAGATGTIFNEKDQNDESEIVAINETTAVTYTDLAAAISAANDGDTIRLVKNVELSGAGKNNNEGALTITKSIVLDGNSKKITATSDTFTPAAGASESSVASMFNVEGGAQVTFKNLTIDSNNEAKHGINIYTSQGTEGKTKVTVENVTIQNGLGYAIVCNSSDLEVVNVTTSGNAWGGINIDNRASGKYSTFTMEDGTIGETNNAVYIENSLLTATSPDTNSRIEASISDGIFQGPVSVEKQQDGTTDVNGVDLSISGGTYENDISDYLDGNLVWNPVTGEVGTPSTPGGGTPSEPEEPTCPFTDVTEGDDWFYGAVAYVYENGIMAGTDETIFDPYMELDRAMAAQLFYNLEGKPTVTGDSAFTDVTSGHWAVDAITWAAQNDIVVGIGGNLYDPDSNVTREQFAVMLYKYARFKGYDLTATGDLTRFPDAGSISSWAETALSWANGNGLINGHENGTIDPKGSTIRAQAASIMANFDQNVAK